MLSKINNKFIKLNPYTILIYFIFLFVLLFTNKSLLSAFVCFFTLIFSIITYIDSNTIKKNIKLMVILILTPFIFNYLYTGNLQMALLSTFNLSSFFLVFLLFNYFIDDTKIFHVFYIFLPKTALVLSISIRYNTLIIKKYKAIYECFKINNSDKFSIKQSLHNASDIFLSVFNIALEDSITLSKSIKSKSYLTKNRSYYTSFKFTLIDFILLTLIIFLFLNFKYSILVSIIYICLPIIFDFILMAIRSIKWHILT